MYRRNFVGQTASGLSALAAGAAPGAVVFYTGFGWMKSAQFASLAD